jgi:hypothetical protein
MKAIEQIITYLNARGLLSAEQLAYLERHGLWDRRGGGGEKGDEVHHTGRVPEPEEVGGELAARFGAWAPALEGLLLVARRLGPCAGWREAAVTIRNAGPEDLYGAVHQGLRERGPALSALWDAVSLEAYREVLDRPVLHGPVAVAYRAILDAPEYAQLGEYAWLLKTEEVGHVFNLKQAQRQLLLACERLFSAQPGAIVLALQRDFHVLAYWAFVLLYSARREHANGPRPVEHPPARQQPDEAGWLRVWAQTAVMDPVRLLPLLVRANARQAPGPAEGDALRGIVFWPKAWDPKGPDPRPDGEAAAPEGLP